MTDAPEQAPIPFADEAIFQEMAAAYGAPLFVHHEPTIRRRAEEALAAPNAFGLTVRYAMKANSHRAVLRILDEMGVHIDASSRWEVRRALAAGVAPERIQLTSQEVQPPEVLQKIVESGVIYNACSLEQLRIYADLFPGDPRPVGVRVNPGLGSGHNTRTNTGGPPASFGIWHEYLDDALKIAADANIPLTTLHTHVGSGSDWRVWQKAADMTLAIARRMPDVQVVNLGGGYKIDRMAPENSIDLQAAFQPVAEAFRDFARETGRELRMEIEPGNYLIAEGCALLMRVVDVVDTGADGFRFLKVDASMTELLRPMIYGARHPIRALGKGDDPKRLDWVVVGMCCESGDIFTPREGDPDEVGTVRLPEMRVGDLMTVGAAGAYGLAMSAKNYNSRPVCAEAMIAADGSHRLISRAQQAEEVWQRELD